MFTQRENEMLENLFEDIFPEEPSWTRTAYNDSTKSEGDQTEEKTLKNSLPQTAWQNGQSRTPVDGQSGTPVPTMKQAKTEKLYAPWTDEEDAYIIEARKRGETAYETGLKLGRTEQSVYARRKVLGCQRIKQEETAKKTKLMNKKPLDTTRENGFINKDFDKCFEAESEKAKKTIPDVAAQWFENRFENKIDCTEAASTSSVTAKQHLHGRKCTMCGTQIDIDAAIYCYICGTSLLTEREKLIADVAKAKKKSEDVAIRALLEKILIFLRKGDK
jgi:hypothetical protein